MEKPNFFPFPWFEKPVNYLDFPVFDEKQADEKQIEEKQIETIWQKFNPYHDPHSGRFTSGSAVTNSLMDAINTQGGFTYNPETGVSPKKGLALSIYPERSKIITASEIQGSDLKSFITKNSDLLRDHSNFLGGWHDIDNNRVFLDISKVVSNPEEAKRLCEKYGQRAYFNLETFETVDVVPEEAAHKAKKRKIELVHIPTDATDAQLEEIARKIREKQNKAGLKPQI